MQKLSHYPDRILDQGEWDLVGVNTEREQDGYSQKGTRLSTFPKLQSPWGLNDAFLVPSCPFIRCLFYICFYKSSLSCSLSPSCPSRSKPCLFNLGLLSL